MERRRKPEGKRLSLVPNKPKRGPLKHMMNVRVDDDMKKRLEAVAGQTGQEVSDVIRYLLDAALDIHERGRRQ